MFERAPGASKLPPQGPFGADEERLAAALKPFGWTCTDDFWRRYYSDPWVFNLANAVEKLSGRLGDIGVFLQAVIAEPHNEGTAAPSLARDVLRMVVGSA